MSESFNCQICRRVHAICPRPGDVCRWCLQVVGEGTTHHPTEPRGDCVTVECIRHADVGTIARLDTELAAAKTLAAEAMQQRDAAKMEAASERSMKERALYQVGTLAAEKMAVSDERDATSAREARLAEALRKAPHHPACAIFGGSNEIGCNCYRAAIAATDALDWLQRQRREARADAAKEAGKLVRRGLKAIARKEWEDGQTLEAWTHEAEEWLATMRLAERIDRAAELEGGMG